MAKTKSIIFRVSVAEYTAAHALARRLRQPLSVVLRDILREATHTKRIPDSGARAAVGMPEEKHDVNE